jgi:hypothetical protein
MTGMQRHLYCLMMTAYMPQQSQVLQNIRSHKREKE